MLLGTAGDVAVQIDRPVVLVGHMGAGKSTVGRHLAEALRVPFLDSDQEVEKAAGCPIPEIFERFGEEEFRKGEYRIVVRLLRSGASVIATGGGAFINDRTRGIIQASSVSVWLRAGFDVLFTRVARSRHRPLLREGNPRDIMERLMRDRDPVYALAAITVECGGGPQDVARRIIEALPGYRPA